MAGRVVHARIAALAVLGVGIVTAVVPAVAGSASKGSAAGCAGTRPVVAHHAGGRVLAHQPRHLPRACGTTTGYAGAESHLVIRNDGSVVYTPAVLPSGSLGIGSLPGDQYDSQNNASPGALAVTSDKGAHWRLVKPSGVTWNPTDHSDYVDPASGRMFFEDYGPIPLAPQYGADQEGPAHINWSDDLEHWHHTVIRGLTLTENPRFTSGRAPAGQPKPKGGYPSVTYFCANTNVGFVSPVIGGRLCYRSLDGGSNWEQRSVLFTGATPQHAECNGQGEVYSAIDGYYPQPAPNGSLYVMVACGGKTYLARSKDEAATFPILHGQSGPVTLPVSTPGPGDVGGSPELRITGDGTFLLSYLKGNRLLLRISATHGVTWSKPIDVTAPGVTEVLQWTMAANAHGDVSFAYLGHRKGQTTWDGYVTGSRDILHGLRSAGGPVFLSGQVNPADRPLLYGDSVQGSGYLGDTPIPYPPPLNNQMFGNDFIGAAIAQDGSPWGSFTQDCGPSRESPGCVRQQGQTRGFAGHLG